jgi:ParB/RepB/Spo0J family partition protein
MKERKKPEVIQVSVENIIPDPDQPRKFFDEEELRHLAISIKEEGQNNPAIVAPRDERGMYMLRAGERRWRACVKENIPFMWVIVVECDPKDNFFYAFSDNTNRLSYTPRELVHGVLRLKNEGRTELEIAKRTGLKLGLVRDIFSFTLLYKGVIANIEHDKKERCITFGEAKILAKRVPNHELQKSILNYLLNAKRHTRKIGFTRMVDVADPEGSEKKGVRRNRSDERRSLFAFLKAMQKGNKIFLSTSPELIVLLIGEMSKSECAGFLKDTQTCLQNLSSLEKHLLLRSDKLRN